MSTSSLTVRLAAPADAAALADLGRRAFVAKFGHLYRPEDLAAFLDGSHTAQKLDAELADPGMVMAVVEDGAGRLLAFCKLLLASSLPRVTDAARPLELKQLYGDPDVLGQGLGARLMDWALDEARARRGRGAAFGVERKPRCAAVLWPLWLRQGGRGGFHGG